MNQLFGFLKQVFGHEPFVFAARNKGGLLESLSFVTGIRALVILVGLFYLLAIWRRPAQVQH